MKKIIETKECKNCKKAFKGFRNKQLFCSKDCVHDFKRVSLVCEKCGITFTRKKCYSMRRFCSQLCAGKRERNLIKQCVICGKDFKTYFCSKDKRFCCSKKCSFDFLHKNITGRKNTPDTIKQMSESALKRWDKFLPTSYRTNPKRNQLLAKIRHLPEYYNWRNMILIRDNFACLSCGLRSSPNCKVSLHVHHLKSLFQIMIDNKISTIEEARDCEEFWDLNNGKTVCKVCHSLEDNYVANFINKEKICQTI